MRSISIRIGYDPANKRIIGCAWVPTPLGPRALIASVRLAPIAESVTQKMLTAELERRGFDGKDEVGLFGFIKDAFNSVVGTAMKVAKAVGITKVVDKIKQAAVKVAETTVKVLKSPITATIIGGIGLAVPGVGPVIAGGYAAVRAAMAIAEGAARGDPNALAAAGKYAAGVVPGAEKVTALIQSVAPTTAAVSAAANPWLQGLQGLV